MAVFCSAAAGATKGLGWFLLALKAALWWRHLTSEWVLVNARQLVCALPARCHPRVYLAFSLFLMVHSAFGLAKCNDRSYLFLRTVGRILKGISRLH